MTEFTTACNNQEYSTQRDLSDDIDKCSSHHHHSDSTMTLPPEVWAMIINYLPYDSLISCASTSRAILYDALPLVTTLHIEKSSQLQIGMISNKLRDVRSVSIYMGEGETELDENIASRTVHFLSNRFPHLESITFLDNVEESCPLNYNSWLWMNEDQRGSIYQLLDSFSGAFSCKAIPPTMEIVGLRCPKIEMASAGECKVCNRICRSFPLDRILNVHLCLPYSSSNEIIKSRRGGRDYLHSEIRFLQLLGKGRIMRRINGTFIIEYTSEVKDEVNSIIESSRVDLSKQNPEKVVEAIMRGYNKPNVHLWVHLTGESFDYLRSVIGLSISNDLLDPVANRIENLHHMVDNIMDGSVLEAPSLVLEGMQQISDLVSPQAANQKYHDHITYLLVESGALPIIIECLQRDKESGMLSKIIGLLNNTEFQPAVLPILIRITAGVHTESVIKLEAIPALIQLLDPSLHYQSGKAALALGNILGNIVTKSRDGRDLVIQAGAIQPLLNLLSCHKTNVKLVLKYTWILANLFTNVSRSNFTQVSSSLPTLIELIHHTNETVLWYACWALRYLSEDWSITRNQTILNALTNTGVRRLITLLEHPHERIQAPVLFTVGFLAHQAQLFIDNNILPGLLTILSNENTNEFVTDCVCWIMNNILSSSKNRIIQAVIDSGIVSKMIPILSSENFHSVDRYRVVEMISYMARGNVNQVHYLVNQGCIPLLLETPTLLNVV